MTKMPTPLMLMLPGKPETAVYSEAQLKQYGRDLLEEAADLCDLFDATHPKYLAVEIRAMKEKI